MKLDSGASGGRLRGTVEGLVLTPDAEEHAEARWCGLDEAQRLVNHRGLKEGMASVREYVTERDPPPGELRLK